MAINKVVYGDTTLIDLTDSTLSSANQLAEGITAYDRTGTKLMGTASGGAVTSVNGQTGDVVLDAEDVGAMSGMTILSYGSSTWQDFLTAYNANRVVYCRASSNANPATGSQTRLAFMAYVNNATSPTEVEFQYYKSVSSHTASQQGDQVFVYKLKSTGWSVLVREAYSTVQAGTGLTRSYANGTVTLELSDAYVNSLIATYVNGLDATTEEY